MRKYKVMHVGSKNPNREYKLNDMFLDAPDHHGHLTQGSLSMKVLNFALKPRLQ